MDAADNSVGVDTKGLGNDDLDTLTHGNGLVTDVDYFANGPIQKVTVGSAPLHRLVYTIDSVLNVDTITETIAGTVQSPAYDYGYDTINRLTSAAYPTGLGLPPTTETFGYDAASNRDDNAGSPSPWSYDANNRLASSPTPGGGADTNYAFDDDGNLVTKTSPAGTETFSFDAINRMSRYQNSAPSQDVAYAYDPFGRRIRKVSASSGTTYYLWDGDQLLAEYDASGARQVRYAYAKGFAPIQVAYANGATEDIYDVHSDHLDTPKVLTDANDAVAWRASHEAFGRAALAAGNDVTFNVRFPGQYLDEESGLHYNRFRTYDPGIGRYVSADPVGQFGGLALDGVVPELRLQPRLPRSILVGVGAPDANLYRYGLGNPLAYADPLGLWAAGGSIEFTVVAPFLSGGGGTVGLNLQYTSDDGLGLYVYAPAAAPSGGLAAGFAAHANVATGCGPWSGDFKNAEGSFGPVGGGYFESTNVNPTDPGWPGYAGVSFGFSAGPPGVSTTTTNYTPLIGGR